MTDPLAHHLYWHTYGTWLPGDDRGSFDGRFHHTIAPDPDRRLEALASLVSEPVHLMPAERAIVTETIGAHAAHRGWPLHAVNALAEHVHVVVTLPIPPTTAVGQFKLWASRRLNERVGRRPRWWAGGTGYRVVWDQRYLDEAVTYVVERQEPSTPR